MLTSIRSKLIVSLLSVTLLVGAVSLLTGVHLLKKHVIGEAANRVELDLTAASEMIRERVRLIRMALNITSLGSGFISAVDVANPDDLAYRLSRLAHHAKLDFAGIVGTNGKVLFRLGSNAKIQGVPAENPIGRMALERQSPAEGTVVLS
ncbi:MAG: two-component sensor histidine kinase, partial [Desulfatitalea sp.]|nr:two-component sensor histidine kinase [Desulfatitalea sp.]